jgi:hypothetical protein
LLDNVSCCSPVIPALACTGALADGARIVPVLVSRPITHGRSWRRNGSAPICKM